jgi:hypothetical protein
MDRPPIMDGSRLVCGVGRSPATGAFVADDVRRRGASGLEAALVGSGPRRHGWRRIDSISENTAFATVWSKKPRRTDLGRG